MFNHLILGTFSYGLLTYLVSLENNSKTFLIILIDYICLLLIQSLGYYFAHIIMNTNKYYFIHKFHHQYSDIVIPMSANAVSSQEYLLAYMMPFIVGIIFLKPNRLALNLAISTVSLANLIIHTPTLSKLSSKIIPKYFVKTSDHLEHHNRNKTKFSSPILNLDYVII